MPTNASRKAIRDANPRDERAAKVFADDKARVAHAARHELYRCAVEFYQILAREPSGSDEALAAGKALDVAARAFAKAVPK